MAMAMPVAHLPPLDEAQPQPPGVAWMLTDADGLQYITVLRKCKLWERLRKAREAMSDRFPLSETLWREWLTDELQNVQRCGPSQLIISLLSRTEIGTVYRTGLIGLPAHSVRKLR
jgi:hypothetical protein